MIIIKVNIGKHEFSIIWEGIYYHALSNYPNISEWELNGIIKFIDCESLCSILSAVKARNMSAEQLKLEPRNAAKDPADYFEYLMLSWGNCQAGDRLVMERKLEREPSEKDLSKGFTPGVRFFFKYDESVKYPNTVFDGYHPLKIKDELSLKNNVFAIIIPELYKESFEGIIGSDIKGRVYYIDSKNKDILEWSEQVYKFIDVL